MVLKLTFSSKMVCLFMSDPKNSKNSDEMLSWFPHSFAREHPDHSDKYYAALSLFEHVEHLLDAGEVDYSLLGAWKKALNLSEYDMGAHLYSLRAEWAIGNKGAIRPTYFTGKFKSLDLTHLAGDDILSFCRFIGVHPADVIIHYNYSIDDYTPLPRGIIEACLMIIKDENAPQFDQLIAKEAIDYELKAFYTQMGHPHSPYFTYASQLYSALKSLGPVLRNSMATAEEAYEILIAQQKIQFNYITGKIETINIPFKDAKRAFDDCYSALFQNANRDNYRFSIGKMRSLLDEWGLSDQPKKVRIEALIEELEENIESFVNDERIRIGRGSGKVVIYNGMRHIGFSGIIKVMATAFVDGTSLEADLEYWKSKQHTFLLRREQTSSENLYGDTPRAPYTLPPEQWRFFDNAFLINLALSRPIFEAPKQISFGRKASSDDNPSP